MPKDTQETGERRARHRDGDAAAAETDAVLVERARGGDKQAFASLVTRHLRLVVAAARSSVGSHEAEDLAQDVFIEAWRGLPALREPARFAAWLLGIQRRMAVYRLRRRKREEEVYGTFSRITSIDPPQGMSPDGQAEQGEALAFLEKQIEALPEAYREVILLRYMAGLGIEEMASLLGISRAACDKRLTRAKSRLKEFMKPRMGEK